MLLAAHNAHLVSLDRPDVPTDPGLGITGGSGLNRWRGDVQAYVDEDTTETVRGNQRILVVDTWVDLPANFPVRPQANDVLKLVRQDGSIERLLVRMVDGGLLLTGRLRIRCRAD